MSNVNRKAIGYPCCYCTIESECADNDWCLYDHRNKKCPNYKEGVKQYHQYMRQWRKGRF